MANLESGHELRYESDGNLLANDAITEETARDTSSEDANKRKHKNNEPTTTFNIVYR